MAMLPRTLDVIDRDWLSGAMRQRFPGVVVASAETLRTIAGTATKRLIRLEYNEAGRAAALPPTMCIKCGFTALHDRGAVLP